MSFDPFIHTPPFLDHNHGRIIRHASNKAWDAAVGSEFDWLQSGKSASRMRRGHAKRAGAPRSTAEDVREHVFR